MDNVVNTLYSQNTSDLKALSTNQENAQGILPTPIFQNETKTEYTKVQAAVSFINDLNITYDIGAAMNQATQLALNYGFERFAPNMVSRSASFAEGVKAHKMARAAKRVK